MQTWLLVGGEEPGVFSSIENLAASAPAPVRVVCCEGVENALATHETAPVLVAVSAPLDYLGRAIHSGENPSTALTAWRNTCKTLLDKSRTDQNRIIMVDAGSLVTMPQSIAGYLQSRLGIHLSASRLSFTGEDNEISALHFIIAAAILAQDEETCRLSDELRTMILGPVWPNVPGLDKISQAVESWRELLHREAELVKELGVLRDTLHCLIAEGEFMETALREELSQVRQTSEDISAENANLETILDEERKARESAEREAEKNSTAFEEKKKILEQAKNALDHERRKNQQLQTELKNARQEIAHIHASTSWKITVPFRKVRLLIWPR